MGKTLAEDPQFAIPEGLSPEGIKAAEIVMDLVRKLSGDEAGQTGGCKAFYSPEVWRNRGEEYGCSSELILCHDGGILAQFCNMDYECYSMFEELTNELQKAGLWMEACTNWYTAVYKI